MDEVLTDMREAIRAGVLTQARVAAESGLSQATIHNLLNDRCSPTMRTVRRLRDGLDRIRQAPEVTS